MFTHFPTFMHSNQLETATILPGDYPRLKAKTSYYWYFALPMGLRSIFSANPCNQSSIILLLSRILRLTSTSLPEKSHVFASKTTPVLELKKLANSIPSVLLTIFLIIPNPCTQSATTFFWHIVILSGSHSWGKPTPLPGDFT